MRVPSTALLACSAIVLSLVGCSNPSQTGSSVALAAAQAAVSSTLPLSERLRIVDAMDRHVRANFAHESGLRGASYDSMVSAFRADARQAEDRQAFDRAAIRFTAGLRNGHSRFNDPWLDSMHGQTLWLSAKRGDDGWVVTMSEYAGLRRGDVIVALDGRPMDSAMTALHPYLQESGTRSRAWTPFHNAHLFPRSFTVTLANGETVRVTRGEPADSVVRARRGPIVQTPHRWIIPDSIGYVRVRRFSPRSHEDSAIAIIRREYLRAPALIVDVRGNGGGNTPTRLLELLMTGTSWRTLPIEKSRVFFDKLPKFGGERRGSDDGYRGKLVVLTDYLCGSACEDFVAPFYDNRRATTVGDTTWGTTGQPRSTSLGNGMSFMVSARRYRFFDGTTFEGVGIPPHVAVPIRAEPLRADRDDALDRATELLRAQLLSPGKP